MEIIDVSKHNGTIDFAGVKAAGVEGVMLRAGYTGWGSYSLNEDPLFENNYADAAAAGLHVGAYYYSAADTANFSWIGFPGKHSACRWRSMWKTTSGREGFPFPR